MVLYKSYFYYVLYEEVRRRREEEEDVGCPDHSSSSILHNHSIMHGTNKK